MSIASEYSGFDPENLLLSHDAWPSYFEEIFENSPDAAESVARILYEILCGIHAGPEGLAKVINTLKDGIEYAYQFTSVNKLGLKLFLPYLDGKLEPWNEPHRLLRRTVERGLAATNKWEEHS
ncbi:MAG TPA: hypothetical protein VEZ90_14060 [Blastocatellia bacterium]|nr:hypothetical protein [Blastocatellia bacterium]